MVKWTPEEGVLTSSATTVGPGTTSPGLPHQLALRIATRAISNFRVDGGFDLTTVSAASAEVAATELILFKNK